MQQEVTDRREWLDRLEIGVVDGSETEEVLGVRTSFLIWRTERRNE